MNISDNQITINQQYRLHIRDLIAKIDYKKNIDTFLCNQLEVCEIFMKAKNIGIYVPTKFEPNVLIIFAKYHKTKHFYVPFIKHSSDKQMEFKQIKNLTTDLEKNPFFKVFQPNKNCPTIHKNKLDLIIVPLVGFNYKLYRLGRGGGYYDRYLENYSGTTCAVCYREQEIDFKVSKYDHQLNFIICS